LIVSTSMPKAYLCYDSKCKWGSATPHRLGGECLAPIPATAEFVHHYGAGRFQCRR
jgi:hypothetical protein